MSRFIVTTSRSGRPLFLRKDRVSHFTAELSDAKGEPVTSVTLKNGTNMNVKCEVSVFAGLMGLNPDGSEKEFRHEPGLTSDPIATARAEAGLPSPLPSSAGHPDRDTNRTFPIPRPGYNAGYPDLRKVLHEDKDLRLTTFGLSDVLEEVSSWVRRNHGDQMDPRSLDEKLSLIGIGIVDRDRIMGHIRDWATGTRRG